MDRADFTKKYWRYYILLENKFITTLNYVELTEDNFSTYSVEYAHQMLSIGSELDTFFKIYCNFPLENRKSINDYTKSILNTYPEIKTQKIQVLNTDIQLAPYVEWQNFNPNSPKNVLRWWDSYNAIKHNRQENLKCASMGNVITSLSALYLIEMKYLQIITEGKKEMDEPDTDSKLFKLEDWKFNYSIVDYVMEDYLK